MKGRLNVKEMVVSSFCCNFVVIVPVGGRISHWRKHLPAQQSEPVDQQRTGAVPQSTEQTGKAFQIHWYVAVPCWE